MEDFDKIFFNFFKTAGNGKKCLNKYIESILSFIALFSVEM